MGRAPPTHPPKKKQQQTQEVNMPSSSLNLVLYFVLSSFVFDDFCRVASFWFLFPLIYIIVIKIIFQSLSDENIIHLRTSWSACHFCANLSSHILLDVKCRFYELCNIITRFS